MCEGRGGKSRGEGVGECLVVVLVVRRETEFVWKEKRGGRGKKKKRNKKCRQSTTAKSRWQRARPRYSVPTPLAMHLSQSCARCQTANHAHRQPPDPDLQKARSSPQCTGSCIQFDACWHQESNSAGVSEVHVRIKPLVVYLKAMSKLLFPPSVLVCVVVWCLGTRVVPH